MDEALRERAVRNQIAVQNDSRAATAAEINETRKTIKAHKELAEQSDKAGKKIGELGLRHAWIIRSATSGGPLGMLGGGLGAAAGGLLGNVGFGALIGNIIGQSVTSGIERMHGLVSKTAPGVALRYERTQADLEATFGQALIPTMERTTRVTRQMADIVATHENLVSNAVQGGVEGILKVNPLIRTIKPLFDYYSNLPGVKGASEGKAISPLGGHVFGGPDELYRSVAAMTMMYSDKGQSGATGGVGPGVEAIMRAGTMIEPGGLGPNAAKTMMGAGSFWINTVLPVIGEIMGGYKRPPDNQGGMLMDSLWLGAFSGTRIT
jgi:hypothetical protein